MNLIKKFQMYSSHVSLECNVVKCTITSQLMAPAHCLPSFLLQTYIVTRRWNVRTAPLQLCNIRILRHRQQGPAQLSLLTNCLSLLQMISFWLFLFLQNIPIITQLCYRCNVSSGSRIFCIQHCFREHLTSTSFQHAFKLSVNIS